MLTVRYYDRDRAEVVSLTIPNDVLEVVIPAQEWVPELRIAVNTDAVIIDDARYKRLAMYEYTDVIADIVED